MVRLSQHSNTSRRDFSRFDLRKPSVYLCGPVTGMPLRRAKAWRERARVALAPIAGVIDPTRQAPDTVRRSRDPATRGLSTERLLHGKEVIARNRFDVQRSDLLLACFLGAKAVSIGAVGEIFWADILGKPIIVVREDGNPHNHDMINEVAGWIFDDLDAALKHVQGMLANTAILHAQ